MLINQIDELFDIILNKFYDFLYKKDIFKKYNKDANFVVYQEDILITIDEFIKTISPNDILKAIKKEIYLEYIYNIIKRFCAFYIYLGIGYYYDEGRDLFITNIIETSKNQKDTTFQIQNFFNSYNNSKIISFFSDIQNIKSLVEFKTMDKIKIIIANNPIKFNNIINIFSELGEDYIINYFLIKDNFHNILKTIIFKLIYLKEEKIEINNLLNEVEKEEGEYKYIEIVIGNVNKIVDFNIIQKFLTIKQIKSGLAEEIYNYLIEMKENYELIVKENQEFINYLFSNKILIPITEEFLRYHKDSEKYDNDSENKKDDTKIKYIINKLNNIRNYYSPIIDKNPKLKLEIERYFYKNLDPRMAMLFNDNEEIKIIQKLMISENVADQDLLIDLQNIRKYAYVNFKNVSNDYIKLRTPNTIESIRSINLKKKKSESIETRIGHNNINLNVIGIAFNPSRININNKTNNILRPIECFTVKDLVNVKDITKQDNGFLSFIKILQKNNSNKLFYWIFNNLKDIPKVSKYINYNKNDPDNNIKIMLADIYDIWTNMVKTKFLNYMDKINSINNWQLEKLIKTYQEKYFNFNFNPEIKNELLNIVLLNKIKELKITEDETDNMIPGKRNKIIELPVANIKKNKKNIIILNQNKKIIEENNESNHNAICHHYIKWDNLKKMSKSNQEDFNQQVFEFVKKYVKENNKGQRLCKSCNELLMLDKYVYEGTYVKELDQFMTTSMAVHQQLTDLPQYINLKRTINNLGKNLEKIAYITDLTAYIGNDSIIKLHRKTVIKDTIDLVLLHTNYLKNQSKDRIEQASIKYNINKEYTNLFFFELKDEIFLTSSTDTDYYKLIKYNNVMIYLIFIIISELNSGQILNFKNDKRCNFFFYLKFGDILFKNLYLRVNDKEKILITQYPLLTYIIYYFSCILTTNRLWLWNETTDNKTESFNINIQKSIIHTIIDLINSITEANLQKEKNYLYEILSTRFYIKLTHTFDDMQLIKRINDNINKKINYDETSKKFSFISKKINFIPIQYDINFENNLNKKYCEVTIKKLNKLQYKKNTNKINSLTNCDDGKFHIWTINNGNMICKLCNKIYSEILKENNTIIYYDTLKLSFIKKLTKKHCISGNLHQFESGTNICSLCKINPDIYKYSKKELLQLENNLDNNNNIEINNKFKKIIQIEQININNKINNKKILNKFNKKFEIEVLKKYSSNNMENYIIDFIDRIIQILGNKIKIKNKITYMKDTLYIIDHDYLGNQLKIPIHILSSDNLISTYNIFKKDVLYYKDKANKVYVYYDIVTLQYLGYSDNNKDIKQNNNNASIKIEYSIKDCLLLLGLENTYTNLYHIDSSLINNFNPDINYIINNLGRNRIINLKQIISRTQSIINSVRNHGKISSVHNIKEKEIVNEFITKLKQFNLKDKDNSNGVFKHSKYICNLVNFKKITNQINIKLNNNYINNNFLNAMYNADLQLIFYIIMNFNRLLDYNSQPAIQSELAHLIIKIIQYSMELYIKENNYDIRSFEYLVLGDVPYIDETIRPIGLYQELFAEGEIDEIKIKENNYDAQEAKDAFDIDDYEVDDDIDGAIEALDGYEE
jgi:hypothetical protein